MARVKLDENVPDQVATVLREVGHDAQLGFDEGLSGAPDDEVLAAARAEGRILMTLDLDFADVVRHDPASSPGIAVLLKDEEIEGRLWVVDEARLRVWPGWRPA